MFTTSCFIRKNTSELREELESLGYEPAPVSYTNEDCIITFLDGYYQFAYSNDECLSVRNDCGDSEEMFLALAALRDDTDKDQLFTNGEDWCIWREEESFNSVPVDVVEHYGIPSNLNLATYHKATADEIIEYFTMEGGAE